MLFEDEIDHSDTRTSLSNPQLLEDYEYHPTTMELFDYDSGGNVEETLPDSDRLREMIHADTVTWLNVMGLRDVDRLQEIRDLFEIHPLILEDVLRPFQRPKVEEYENHLFAVLQLVHPEPPHDSEQIGFVLGPHYLITFQETQGDVFDPIRRRIRQGRTRLIQSGPDYLAYELLDAVVDGYFPVLETLGDELEVLEDAVLQTNDDHHGEIHDRKRFLLTLRRAAWSQREMLGKFQQIRSEFVQDETRIYLRDAYDHSIRILDIIESYREMVSSLQDLYLTAVSNRMNEVMKVLTVIATIFIPLTFIAGVYGMNFNPEVSPWNMPELNWYWGYPAVMGFMFLIAVALLIGFRRRDWI